ncbi:hypothetical protein ACPPVO_23050 [Dactylosporangium sp. McL0621]
MVLAAQAVRFAMGERWATITDDGLQFAAGAGVHRDRNVFLR